MELRRKYPALDLIVLIVSVQNRQRIHRIFEHYRPNIIFHAAAHKHVPLMEDSPCDAIKNNCFGTANVAKEAGICGAKRMVLISTDKAVRPTNIMGASKRICELVIQYFNSIYDTEYMAVRFGNVLGSNGSVVPLFREQIKNGGPVTVTHPNIIRYFMLIPEAVNLVLEAGAYGHGGEIFILDMGEPVKILDLAENMIRLSGYEPYTEMQIKFTGLRPGEKLYEELLINESNKIETNNNRIFIAQLPLQNMERFKVLFDKLEKITFSEDKAHIRQAVQKLVPEYKIVSNE
jgi:FlaA1/EpsC-like NDP-sugar epimerase